MGDPGTGNYPSDTGNRRYKGDFGKEGGIHKFLFMGDEEAVIRTENRLKERYPQLSIARSKPVYLEVMNGNVCKSAGVKIVCENMTFLWSSPWLWGRAE